MDYVHFLKDFKDSLKDSLSLLIELIALPRDSINILKDFIDFFKDSLLLFSRSASPFLIDFIWLN